MFRGLCFFKSDDKTFILRIIEKCTLDMVMPIQYILQLTKEGLSRFCGVVEQQLYKSVLALLSVNSKTPTADQITYFIFSFC